MRLVRSVCDISVRVVPGYGGLNPIKDVNIGKFTD